MRLLKELIIIIQYFKERFPVAIALIYSWFFALAVEQYSENVLMIPANGQMVLIIATFLFLFFVRLRLVDEFKDNDYDKTHHIHRPVARGFISLNSLRRILILTVSIELLLLFIINRQATIIYFVLLFFSYMMYKEFLMKQVLKKHILVMLLLHQLVFAGYVIFSLVILTQHFNIFNNVMIFWFIMLLYTAPLLFELGRKLKNRRNAKGEATDDTYIYFWGRRKSLTITLVVAFIQLISLSIILPPDKQWLTFPSWVLTILLTIIIVIKPKMASNSAKIWSVSMSILAVIVYIFYDWV